MNRPQRPELPVQSPPSPRVLEIAVTSLQVCVKFVGPPSLHKYSDAAVPPVQPSYWFVPTAFLS